MSDPGTEEQAGRRAAFSLQWQMLVGFLIGLTAGLVAYAVNPGAPWIDAVTRYLTGPIGQIFLRLLFMLVIPLLVSALIVGIAEMGEMRSLRRVGLRTLLYTLIVSGIAVVISLALVNLLQPGSGVDPAQARALLADAGQGAKAILDRGADTPTGMQALIAIVPDNVIAAMADNDILAVMVFALFFGIGLVLVQTKETKLLLDAMEGLFAVTMRLISIVIRLAPIAIACFMFNLAAQFGWDLLLRLSAYVGVVLLALAIQMFGIYSLLIGLLARDRRCASSPPCRKQASWPLPPPPPTPPCRPPSALRRRICTCRAASPASSSPSAPPPTRMARRCSRGSRSCSSPNSSMSTSALASS
jgi:DAACS family dicarboxylate/amino acid:cation (Na+ or H+) symporter